ncbi:MAG: pyrroloquinoline quinone-dependent dehydrogenase [Puia sp.]|nr:pyrroloquinoline quinone-dependent dehydrogenase [Puia sp.]
MEKPPSFSTRAFWICWLLIATGCNRKNADWAVYKADAASSSYSPLDQVNTGNVGRLKHAWTFSPDDAPAGARWGRSECNPIVVGGVLYATSARHRAYAVDAATGKQLWSFDPFNGEHGGGVNRGVTYWEDGKDRRILFTGGDNLYALDAGTGKPIPSFGQGGKVSMNVGIRDDSSKISVKPTSPGIVFGDLLIVGNEVSELFGAQPGYVRAYNIRTGKLEWTFHTIPHPGEPGYETWPKDAWKYAGGANDWSGMSVDEKRGMVFLALGSPSYDYYGADRKGQDLFGNCVVALDAKTGKLIWYFQTIHHDLWDYDLPAPPNLVTVLKDGKKIDAVAQTSKVGFLYVLNRETGESLFPIEERKVPVSDVPGEETWPTQPFPLKPKPYSRQLMTEDDLWGQTPATHDSLVRRFRALRYDGLFTPPSTKGSLDLPGSTGGIEWGGAAYDPATGLLYVKSNEAPEIAHLQKVGPEIVGGQGGTEKLSGYHAGRTFYMSFCASCHREDRNGQEGVYPSLLGLDKRLKKEEVLNKIREGGGKMPPFASVLKGHEDAIVAFLFNIRNEEADSREASLSEIRSNRLANPGPANGKGKDDTSAIYLNLSAYAQFEDDSGNPAIRPPLGNLNAIDLSTGEYVWKIPVGNFPELQQKNGPVTGMESSPGPIVTAGGLIFLTGTKDKKLWAFDKATGQLKWETDLPGSGSSTPCTYMVNGKQYIALSVSGWKDHAAGYIVAYALP